MAKRVVCGLVAGVLALSLVGCGKDDSQTSGEQGEKTKITLSFWEPSTSKEMENGLTAVVEEYKKVKPNVEIELMSQPYSGYTDWMKTRFAANDAPDISENQSLQLEDQFRSGLLHDISDVYNGPNPYADNQIWKDIFIDGKLSAAHNGLFEPSFAIPFSGLGIAYYYNKDIYEELNLEIPETWSEFLDNCEVIAQADYNPIAMMLMKNDAISWLNWHINTSLFANKYLADPNFNPNQDMELNARESARAIALGYFDVTQGDDREAFEQYLDIVEELSQYTEGASGLDEAGAKAQFLAGKAAHLMSGSWDIRSFVMEPTTDINIGAFPLPKFTKEDGEFAGDGIAISSVQTFAITNSVNNDPAKEEAAQDFMMFLTAPDYYKLFINVSYQLPVVKSLDIDPAFDAFNSGSVPPMELFGKYDAAISKASIFSATQIAMSGTDYDRDALLADLQKSANEYVSSIEARYSVSEENNWGVDDLPKNGEFHPTEP